MQYFGLRFTFSPVSRQKLASRTYLKFPDQPHSAMRSDSVPPVWSGSWIFMNLRWFQRSPVLAIMGFEAPERSRPIPVSADRCFQVVQSTPTPGRSEEHTSELQSPMYLV